jgi:heme exporter protein A
MLKINNLQFEYPEQKLFLPINLEIASGSCLQLIGRNGIGKSTVLKILAGITAPKRGRIFWQGSAVSSLAPFAHYLGHHLALKNQLSILENLHYYAKIMRVPPSNVTRACAFFELTTLQSKAVNILSAGQKQRCQLAKLLISDTRIWLLDEPYTALDEMHSNRLLNLFEQFLAQAGTIIFTSHQALMSEKFPVHTYEIKPHEH